MKRSHAFLLSALLSLVVTSAYLAYGNRASIPVGSALAAPSNENIAPSDPTDIYLAQERALQANISETQTLLASMDTDYAAKILQMEEQIALAQQTVQEKAASIASSTAEIEAVNAAIGQDALVYEQQIASLQANETQLLQTLESTMATLQAAQNELAMQQQVSSSGGGGSSSSTYYEHDDDDDDEHEGEEHEHEEHEHEHDDDD